MFHSARLKLTAFYLLIIMLICIFFSISIYRLLSNEIERGLRIQRFRIENPRRYLDEPLIPFVPVQDPALLDEITERLRFNLILINMGILVVSGIAGYFLAGRTLHPIEEMVEDQKRFIADASHELRTPLTSIKTETEVGLRDRKLNLAKARKLLNSNIEEVNKMQELSNYLLALSRYQNSQLKLNYDRLNLSDVLEKAKEKVMPIADKKNIKVTLEGKSFRMDVNEVSLIQLLSIFMENAVKYSPRKSNVRIKAMEKGSDAIITISDNGVGIDEKDIPFIFNRFYRADTSRSKLSADGFGLGLSIAKSIVDLYHGGIAVHSISGKGTVFTINLPLRH